MGDYTSVLTGEKARKKVRSGVNQVFHAVRLTLGPEGQNAILPRTFNRGPRLTNDGVTVSENIKPKMNTNVWPQTSLRKVQSEQTKWWEMEQQVQQL